MTDLDKLEELAKAATPGPWEAEVDGSEGTTEINAGSALTTWTEYEDGLRIGSPARSWHTTDRIVERDDLYDDDFEQAAADAEFIAAANPTVILDWTATHRAALSRIARVEALHQPMMPDAELHPTWRVCRSCLDSAGEHISYPCATKRALTEGENE